MNRRRAEAIMEEWRGQSLLVLGDLILDRYVSGSVERISPEAPVPVVHVTSEEMRPGGAANVALNIQSLGGQAVVAGIVGQDPRGHELLALLAEAGISADAVLTARGQTTCVKTRILSGRQQIVRVDRENGPGAVGALSGELADRVRGRIADVDGIILEDYGKGTVTQAVVDAVLAAAKDAGVPVGLDPKDNHELAVRGVTLATPNHREALLMSGLPERPLSEDPANDEVLHEATRRLLDAWSPEHLMITLGSRGMLLVEPGSPVTVVPTRAVEVFDVSGAGDTVIAVAMLSLVAGATFAEAAALANCAAGVVVGKLGTATCTPDELLDSLEE